MRILLTIIFSFSLLINTADAGKPKPPKKDKLVTIKTDIGEIVVILFDKTVNHKAEFLKLVEGGNFARTSFFKSLPSFFIQGGNPEGNANMIKEEPGGVHKKGAFAAIGDIDAETGVKKSHIDKFYIVTNPKGTNFLNKTYTVYGEVIKGIEVVDSIAGMQSDNDFVLQTPVNMTITAEEWKRKKVTKEFGYEYIYEDK